MATKGQAVLFYNHTTPRGDQVRAVYNSAEEAIAQAEHDERQTDERTTDRVEVDGEVVWSSPENGAETYDPKYPARQPTPPPTS